MSHQATERKLRQFLKKEMQMSNDDLEEMQFERVCIEFRHIPLLERALTRKNRRGP